MADFVKNSEVTKNRDQDAEFVFVVPNPDSHKESVEQVFRVLEMGLKISHREIGSLKGLSFNYLNPLSSQKKIKTSLSEILSNNICLGEFYGDISSKKFLIKNMQILKDKGFNVLFMEHLYTHSHQRLLDRDFTSHELSNYLEGLNKANMNPTLLRLEGQRDQARLFNFKQLVLEARRVGIRVIALDNQFIHQYPDLKDGNNRRLVFNAFAKYIINKTTENYKCKALPLKWIALVGNSYVNDYKIDSEIEPIPGIADVVQCCDLLIFDSKVRQVKNNHGEFSELEIENSSLKMNEKKQLLESKLSERKGLKASIFVINKLSDYLALDPLRIERYDHQVDLNEVSKVIEKLDDSEPEPANSIGSGSVSEHQLLDEKFVESELRKSSVRDVVDKSLSGVDHSPSLESDKASFRGDLFDESHQDHHIEHHHVFGDKDRNLDAKK